MTSIQGKYKYSFCGLWFLYGFKMKSFGSKLSKPPRNIVSITGYTYEESIWHTWLAKIRRNSNLQRLPLNEEAAQQRH